MWNFILNYPGEALCLAGVAIAIVYIAIVGINWLLAELLNH